MARHHHWTWRGWLVSFVTRRKRSTKLSAFRIDSTLVFIIMPVHDWSRSCSLSNLVYMLWSPVQYFIPMRLFLVFVIFCYDTQITRTRLCYTCLHNCYALTSASFTSRECYRFIVLFHSTSRAENHLRLLFTPWCITHLLNHFGLNKLLYSDLRSKLTTFYAILKLGSSMASINIKLWVSKWTKGALIVRNGYIAVSMFILSLFNCPSWTPRCLLTLQ